MTFGQWIKQKRKILGLDGANCAERAGMSASTWSRYEADQSRRKDGKPSEPRSETVSAIAKGLGVPVNEVFTALEGLATKPPIRKPETILLARLAPKFEELPESQWENIALLLERDLENYSRLVAA